MQFLSMLKNGTPVQQPEGAIVKKKQTNKQKNNQYVFQKNSVYKEIIINKLNLLKLQKNILKQNYFKKKSLKVFFQKTVHYFNFQRRK